MERDAPVARPRRLWLAAGILLLLTAAGVVEALQQLVPGARMAHYGKGDMPVVLVRALFHTLPSWWLLGLLIPLAAWLVSRRPIVPEAWKGRVLLHLVASGVFPVVHIGIVALFYGIIVNGMEPLAVFLDMTSVYYVYDLFIYWLIVGAIHVFRYHRELKDREIREVRLVADLTAARFSALRSQLNPHFLFNSLNTVVGMALDRGDEEVADAVTELSELLRESLRGDEARLVPLADELAFVRRYLRLQKHRFGDRLSFGTAVDADAEASLVPAMLLQPLVENAIEHGVLPGRERGHVEVRAGREGDRLRVEVRDTGPGFPDEAGTGDGDGLGLANTRSRLQLLYGGEADLRTRNREDGASVVVLLPLVGQAPARGRRRAVAVL